MEYERTSLTPKSVAATSGYIDWITQPATFKHYPSFLFSYSYHTHAQLQLIELSRVVTSREMIASHPYYKLNTPSAGNLHPLELYVQIRSIKGIISGIYHVDAAYEKIVLIQEIDEDGVESAVGLKNKFEGMIFMLSYVPYRSEWKYGERALRYCYLDAGHQIAAINLAATFVEQKMTYLSGFDVDELNRLMGFKTEEFMCCVMLCGKSTDKIVAPLKKPLIYVAPTDYSDASGYVNACIAKEQLKDGEFLMLTCKPTIEEILARRSARKFNAEKMQDDDLSFMFDLTCKIDFPLHCYTVVLEDQPLNSGLYYANSLIKQGDFTKEIIALLVDQQFLKNASMVCIITSEQFSADTLMLAGEFAHSLALCAQHKALGFTGIGAFYDQALQKFLDTQEKILYVTAIGNI